jgi:hypothetical protein
VLPGVIEIDDLNRAPGSADRLDFIFIRSHRLARLSLQRTPSRVTRLPDRFVWQTLPPSR